MDTDKLLSDLVRDEGLRLRPYADTVGKTTIGVGRNLTDVGISHDEALALLRNDVDRTQADLDRLLPWWRSLDEVRGRALANWCFNVGIASLQGFKQALAALQAGDWPAASEHMLASLWARQVGVRAQRLARMVLSGQEA